MNIDFGEDSLVEQPAIALFEELGWETANCFSEFDQITGSPLGRETSSDVILKPRLQAAIERLNPDLPPESVTSAIDQIAMDRSVMSMVAANREVYRLLKDGVKVKVRDGESEEQVYQTVRIIDWNDSENNDFFLASQFWVTSDMYKKRPDLIGFVNGIPLVFIELKASHRRLENAYNKNLNDYKDTIPQLFWYNAFIILSNGSQSMVGSITAQLGHFNEWKKISSEGEVGVVSLDTMIRGTCEKNRCLDMVENFSVFSDYGGDLIKMVAKNHQYLGVNNALDAVTRIEENKGRLGVFWHTQGSGKSVSMIFLSQKIMRKLTGNYTFVIVTDRKDLDRQIYKFFASTGSITETEAHADSGEHLKQLLREDHRYVFTLIQKFQTDNGETYPVLSDRSDIIVITDEAHRSQYDTFALNMRNALPNASFIGFTGTPLIATEEKTREVFGEYVSIYNFRQSIDDGATVPLFYENRIPQLELKSEDLNEKMEQLLEEAELDEDQEKKLEREFAREYHLITRDDRLEKVAEDIVSHFMGRGLRGKAMVISIDKATAVRMYDKVQVYWKKYLDNLKSELMNADFAGREEERDELAARIVYMQEANMAVVVSSSQNEVEEFRKHGLDIATHRRRMVKEDLDTKFKESDDPFRIVFVCAMWMTGFDVPSCSTIYLDKPMRNHTLMQTIARANRVFKDKVNGLIVDYVGVFRNLQKALAIYGSGGGVGEGDMPVQDKSALVEQMKKAVLETEAFCVEAGIDLSAIEKVDGFDRIKLLDDAVEAILVSDESKKRYLGLADTVNKLFKAILPDIAANEYGQRRKLIVVIADKIRSLAPKVDVSDVMQGVDELLDESVGAEGYVMPEQGESNIVDLSLIDFDALKAKFTQGRKHTEAEKLKGALTRKINQMVKLNRSRMDYLEKLKAMIDDYNSGASKIDGFFENLLALANDLNEEDKRGISENLTEEELAMFDLLTKPRIELSKKEEKQVKEVARELLETLKKEKLVLDWRKKQETRAAVMIAIEESLDTLPEEYTKEIFDNKCALVYQHVYESYFGSGQSIYVAA